MSIDEAAMPVTEDSFVLATRLLVAEYESQRNLRFLKQSPWHAYFTAQNRFSIHLP